MTGEEAITGPQIVFMLVVLGTVAGAWWRVEAAIAKAKNDALLRAEAALALATLLREELSAHKLHVAERYITKEGMREVRDEILSAMRDLKSTVEHLSERIDRVADGPPKSRQRGQSSG